MKKPRNTAEALADMLAKTGRAYRAGIDITNQTTCPKPPEAEDCVTPLFDTTKRRVEYMLERMNNQYGCGIILKIVWGIKFAGVNQTRHGIVVRQQQYGMDGKFFTLLENDRVRFLGRKGKY